MEIKKIKMNPMNSAAHIKEESVVSSSFLKLGSQRTGRKRTATMAVSSFLRYNLTPTNMCPPYNATCLDGSSSTKTPVALNYFITSQSSFPNNNIMQPGAC